MNREAYRLANEIRTDFQADGDRLMERPEDLDMKTYEANALQEIRKEKRKARRAFGKMTVAACAAVTLLTGTVPGAWRMRWGCPEIWKITGT